MTEHTTSPSGADALRQLWEDRAVAVVRAPAVPDAAALCRALAEGGIRTVELTFTTPDVLAHLRRAADDTADAPDAVVGAGTVLTEEQAGTAIEAGARFLVTPGVRPGVARVAAEAGVPVLMGALTPTEVMAALDLGVAAVKVFPAAALGPRHVKDLLGPLPGARLVPSGGITERDARSYLEHGASAVTAGTSVVPPDVVAAGGWAEVTARARAFTAAIA